MTSTLCPSCRSSDLAVLLEYGSLRVLTCHACGLGFQPAPAVVEFDQAEAHYGERNLAHRRALDHELMEIARERRDWASAYLPDRVRLLEVGGGTGEFCSAAREIGWDVTLVELSAPFVAEVKQRYGIEAVRELVRPGLFPDASFDAIALFHVIEHLPNPDEMLSALLPMLSSSGRLLLILPNVRGFTDRLMGRFAGSLRQPDHLYHHTPATLTSLLERRGFEVVDLRTVEPPHHVFTSLYGCAGLVRRTLGRRKKTATASASKAGGGARLPFRVARVLSPLTAPYRRWVQANNGGHEIVCVARRRV
jgi:SAM-dependent methyltransferase